MSAASSSSARSRERSWFAVSRFTLAAEPRSADPAEVELFWIHAKEVGTLTTACGLATLSWHKHWAPFKTIGRANRYPDCIRVVTADRPSNSDINVVSDLPRIDHRFVDL